MRLGRWLILSAIFAIIIFVADTYFRHRASLFRDALAAPRSLDLGLESSADKWCDTAARRRQRNLRNLRHQLQGH